MTSIFGRREYFGTEGVYACLFKKCFILVRVDATHQSSTATSSTPSDPNFSMHKAGHSGSNILGSNIDAT